MSMLFLMWDKASEVVALGFSRRSSKRKSLVSQRFEQVLLSGKIVRLGGFNGPSE